MTESDVVDVAVIGGGAAGLAAAQTVAAQGRSVVLVESGRLGGECTWNGCVPSKALIEAARLRYDIGRASSFGIDVGAVDVDFRRVMAHVRDRIAVIAGYEDVEHLEQAGIRVLAGRARIASGGGLLVDGRHLPARSIVICTGSEPAVPPIPGLESVPYLTNETLFDLDEQPRRLAILGAGPIGLEMAQAFARLGSEVVVVDLVDRLLPREDPTIAERVTRFLEAEGIRFLLGATVSEVRPRNDQVEVEVLQLGTPESVVADRLLVATGRRPRVHDLGLEDAGVRVAPGGIVVDRHLRTTAPSIFAAGDVTGILPFTHVASYQGRIAALNALGKRRRADYRTVPWVIFTDPEIAHVGLTEPEARAQRADVRVATLPYSAVDRAVIRREPRGLLKVVTGRKSVLGHAAGGELLGAHIVGPAAGELIHEFAVAMQVRAFAGRLAQTIHAYPTLALGVQQTIAQLFAAGRATAGPLRLELEDEGEAG